MTNSDPPEDPDRKENIGLYKAALESFDKTMVSVAGGALAVSITFIHELAPTPLAESKVALWIGWGGLMLSLGLIIISMLTGHEAIERKLAEDAARPDKWWTDATTKLNVGSVVALLVGFIGLAYFAETNMFAPKAPAKPTSVTIQPAPPATAIPVQASPPITPALPTVSGPRSNPAPSGSAP